jgi:hypothetical protein
LDIIENVPQRATVVYTKGDVVGVVQGEPVWTLTPSDAATMVVEPGTMSVVLTWVKEGVAVLEVTGDADLGEGVLPVTASADLVFPASSIGATAATINFAPV